MYLQICLQNIQSVLPQLHYSLNSQKREYMADSFCPVACLSGYIQAHTFFKTEKQIKGHSTEQNIGSLIILQFKITLL